MSGAGAPDGMGMMHAAKGALGSCIYWLDDVTFWPCSMCHLVQVHQVQCGIQLGGQGVAFGRTVAT
jgi:hypothetical protein